jgi:16S rRNA (cytidine1402-2'-O)-methyltransferase
VETSKGKLTLIPTPIGNLDDITLRALQLLKSCDYIYAEDTRTSGVLCKHWEIKTPLRSFHAHNEHDKVNEIIELVKQGLHIGVVSDAGTPGISDPGFLVVKKAIESGIDPDVLPGATAFVPALVCSGLPSDKFVFEGFLPVKKGRKTRLEQLQNETRTMIFYESPYRVLKTLENFAEIWGPERQASTSREISKFFQQTNRGSLLELIGHFTKNAPKGEFVIVVAGKNEKHSA